MNETKQKIRAMMDKEVVGKRREELNEKRIKKSIRKAKGEKGKTKQELSSSSTEQKKKLLRSLFLVAFIILFSLGLFYGAAVSKKSVENKYQQKLEVRAKIELESLISQAVLTMSHKINNFNYVLKDAEYIKNFTIQAWQEILKTELAALLGAQAVVEILPVEFDNDEIIDNADMGYAVLSLLNELKTTKNARSAEHMKVEMHRANSENARLIFVRKVTYFDSDLNKEVHIGYIVASLSPVFMKELIKEFNTAKGYVEIVQQFSGKASILEKKGDSSLKSQPLVIAQKMNNTLWTFNYWPEKQRHKPPASLFWQSFAFLGSGSLAFVSAMLLLVFVIKRFRTSPYAAAPSREKNTNQVKAAAASAEKVVGNDIYHQGDGIAVETGNSSDLEYLTYVMEKIFTAYDIRGVVGEFINAGVFQQIGYAIAREMSEQQQNKIAIACDGRNSSPELVKALIDALLESGINVIDIGMVTSPVLYYAAITKADGNGIIVTASHNPKNYNGMKIMLAGHSYSSKYLQNLKQRVLDIAADDNEKVTGAGRQVQLNVMEEYITKIMGNVILARPMSVVIDTGNGVAGKFSSTFFEQLGCKVTALNAEVDGNFPAHDPDPSRPENMTELVQKVTEIKADLGIAFDGDGDRIGLVSSGGEIIWPDRILMLLARDILSRNKDATILYDVKSSGKLADFISHLGGKPLMCRSGHSFMKSKLLETGALLAGEMSGHIFIKERWYGFDDALFAAARVLEILSIDLRKSRQVFAELPDSLNTPEILIATENGAAVMAKISADSSAFAGGKVITIDGIRVEYPDGWGLVRASNTMANLSMRFEADDEAALQRIATVFKDVILTAAPELEFPF